MADEHKKLTVEDMMPKSMERIEAILAKGPVEEVNTTDAISSALAAVTGTTTLERAQEIVCSPTQKAIEIINKQKKKLQDIVLALLDAHDAVVNFPKNKHFGRLQQLFPDIAEWASEEGFSKENFDLVLMYDIIEVIDELMPYIESVMRQYQDKTGNNSISFGTFMGWDGQDESTKNECLFDAMLNRIKGEEENPEPKLLDVDLQLFSGSLKGSAKAHTVKQTETVMHPKRFPFPLDKVNFAIWRELPEYKTGDIVQIKSEKDGSKENLDILFRLVFDEISERASVVKTLSEDDRLNYLVVAGLYEAGNKRITATQIYKQKGHQGSPSSEIVKKIQDSIEKMRKAELTLDNKQEADRYKGYSWFQYKGSLLPCEIVSEHSSEDNSLAEIYIYPLVESPLIRFARERNQLSYISPKMLQLPISKTETNLKMDTYLVWRIKRAKNNNKKKNEKILLSTLYSHCDITTKKQKQRAPEKYRQLLDHYKSCGLITGYKEDKDSIIVKL